MIVRRVERECRLDDCQVRMDTDGVIYSYRSIPPAMYVQRHTRGPMHEDTLLLLVVSSKDLEKDTLVAWQSGCGEGWGVTNPSGLSRP